MRSKFTYNIKLDENNQVFDNSANTYSSVRSDDILYRKFVVLRNMILNILYPENNISEYNTFHFQNLLTGKSLSVNLDDIDLVSSYTKTFYNYAFEEQMKQGKEGIESCMEVLTIKQDKLSLDFYLYYFENKYSDLRVAFNSDQSSSYSYVYESVCRMIKTLNRTLKIDLLFKN